MREKAEKILDEMPVEDMEEFIDACDQLNYMLFKYCQLKDEKKDADSLMTASLAYHMSKIVDKFLPAFKRLAPMRDYWKEINEEIWEAKISGKGKTLC